MIMATVGGLATLAGAVVLGVAAVLGAAAADADLWVALVLGGVAEAAVAAGGFALLLRRSAWRARLAGGMAAALVAASAVAVGVPLRDAPATPKPVAGQEFWHLPSGSVLRYVHVPARGVAHPSPVVFLHGGPGVADLAGDSAYFGRLADDGYAVYVYDQLGAGGSSRLTDPAGYGRHRDVTDLEQIRRIIGADRMNLIGLSYGATLATAYLVAHPHRVRRMVLLSPGALDPSDASSAGVAGRLNWADRLATYAAVTAPRALLAYGLLQVNPADAHALFPDAEADARNDRVLRLSEPALHCPGTDARSSHYHGTGFYRLQYPQSAAAPAAIDLRPRLRGLATPTLIIKGSCDYLSWRSAIDYRQALQHSVLLYLRGAGHLIYQDKPERVHAAILAFLDDRRLPVAPYPETATPPDYQGPN